MCCRIGWSVFFASSGGVPHRIHGVASSRVHVRSTHATVIGSVHTRALLAWASGSDRRGPSAATCANADEARSSVGGRSPGCPISGVLGMPVADTIRLAPCRVSARMSGHGLRLGWLHSDGGCHSASRVPVYECEVRGARCECECECAQCPVELSRIRRRRWWWWVGHCAAAGEPRRLFFELVGARGRKENGTTRKEGGTRWMHERQREEGERRREATHAHVSGLKRRHAESEQSTRENDDRHRKKRVTERIASS